MEVEIWKDIEGFENKYQISNLGNVKTLDRYDSLGRFHKSKLLKISIEKDGYEYITLLGNKGATKSFFIHRLVVHAFMTNLNDLPQINHKDGNKTNNKVDNLEWLTAKQNVRHALRTGLRKSGENHPWAILTNYQVQQVPVLLEQGLTQKAISKLYNVSYSCIKNICQKRKWNYLSNNLED